eukprot:TRINITY_DN11335_c0_g1_i1.p1 TRINITY_DN11335_c0_g1~~TRINITY_DN11335_c0_g1_i1.p1  ORF type:complete len:350 (-),score=60.48 TRINITY_DN11335_c0_g1_i1:46-1041(-)
MDQPITTRTRDSPTYNIRILSGNANRNLAEKIAARLGVQLEPCILETFSDGELNIRIENNVRGADVFIIQPTCPQVNNNLMELLLLIHTLKLSSAKRITAIVPYFGYARQDRKTKPRVPISASAVAQLIEKMGPNRVVTVDLHCGQIQGFFHQIPVDNLFAEIEFINYLQKKDFPLANTVIVSPDAGGVNRARRVADKLGASSVVTILKRRAAANQIEQMQIVGDVNGSYCIIVDDMIDTAGTLCAAANLLRENGALKVFACATHGIFSGPAIDRLNASVLEEICVTDSIPQEKNVETCSRLIVLSLVPLLSQTILHLHEEKSLTMLFDEK